MPRRRPQRLLTAAAVCGALVAGGSGCAVWDRFVQTGPGEPTGSPVDAGEAREATPAPPSEATPSPATLAQLEQLRSRADLARVGFCELVDEQAVRGALGLLPDEAAPEPERTTPGDRVEIEGPDGVQQLEVSEFACRWELLGGPMEDRAPGERTAAITVFAPPVTPARSAELARAARSRPGCRELPGLATVGLPGAVTSCEAGALRSEGRVGDTWIACELTRQDLAAQLGEAMLEARLVSWCVHALEQLDTSRS